MEQTSAPTGTSAPRVAGLDLSLTGPGVAVVSPDWGGDVSRVVSGSFPHDELRGPTDAHRVARAAAIANDILELLVRERATHAFVEGYGFQINSQTTRAYSLGELGGIVRFILGTRAGLMPRSIAMPTARKLFLGRGNAKKEVAIAALASLGWTRTHDEGDALLIANAGLAELGLPAVTLV